MFRVYHQVQYDPETVQLADDGCCLLLVLHVPEHMVVRATICWTSRTPKCELSPLHVSMLGIARMLCIAGRWQGQVSPAHTLTGKFADHCSWVKTAHNQTPVCLHLDALMQLSAILLLTIGGSFGYGVHGAARAAAAL